MNKIFFCLLLFLINNVSFAMQRRIILLRQGTSMTEFETRAKIKQEQCGWLSLGIAGITAIVTAGLGAIVTSQTDNHGICMRPDLLSSYNDPYVATLDCCCKCCLAVSYVACVNGCCALCDCD